MRSKKEKLRIEHVCHVQPERQPILSPRLGASEVDMAVPRPQMSGVFRTSDDPQFRDRKRDRGPERRRCMPQPSPEQVSEDLDGNLDL